MTTYYAIPTTWNPADRGVNVVLSGGNLSTSSGLTGGSVRSIASVTTGVYYWEVSVDPSGSNAQIGGVANALAGYDNLTAETHAWVFYPHTATKYLAASGSSYGSVCTTGDIIGFKLDMGAGTLELFKITSGVSTSMGVMATGLVGPLFAISGGDTNGVATISVANFGPTFAGTVPTGAYAGFGAIGVVGTGNLNPALGVLPVPKLVGYSGATGAMGLPVPQVVGYQTGLGNFALRAPALSAVGHDASFDRYMSVALSAPTLAAYAGANANISMPSLATSLSGTVTGFASVSIAMPTPTLSASGTTTVFGEASFTFGSGTPTYAMVGYSGAVLAVTLNDGYTLNSSGTTGGVGEAAMTLPLYNLVSASGSAQNHGGMDALMPALHSLPGAVAWMTLPGVQFVAIGTAVVTATYEAYAANLNHTAVPGDNTTPIAEMTRYVNFPFTHIVRYKNSYFGAAADGLYLLEGPDDNGTPTAYAMQTALTDFGTVALRWPARRSGDYLPDSRAGRACDPLLHDSSRNQGPDLPPGVWARHQGAVLLTRYFRVRRVRR